MRILLDNCVPKRAKRLFVGHEVAHASEVGMSALANGLLLRTAAERGFDVLITVDQNIRREHRLEALPVPVLELNTRDSRLPAISAMSSHFESALASTRTHRFVSLDASGRVEAVAVSAR